MISIMKFGRTAIVAAAIATTTACANAGGLGGILGSVLGGGAGQEGQVTGTIQNVDTRNQVVNIRQSNGQNVSLSYDNQTQVVYQNRNYAVTDLETGDQVTATVQTANNSYYVSRVNVDVSSSTSGSTGTNNSRSLTGNVRQVDANNGWFTINTPNSGTITVTMPYNPTRSDLTRFQNLRSGDYVSLIVSYLNNTRVELIRFNN